MRNYHIVDTTGKRKYLFPLSAAKSYDICIARIAGIARCNKQGNRKFELWEDLNLIARVSMSRHTYQVKHCLQIDKKEHEKDLFYANRRKTMTIGFSGCDLSSWVNKNGSKVID
jgi:hypothetical protein